MNQTAVIFGVLVAAFLFYVTTRGDLPRWLGLFGLASSGGSAGGQLGSSPYPGVGTSPAALGMPGLPALPSILGTLNPAAGLGNLAGGIIGGALGSN